MGNQCCNQRGFLSDNNAENLILESMHYYRSKLKNQQEISQLIVDTFHTTLFDIEANPYQWITQKLYNTFLASIESNQNESNAFIPQNRKHIHQRIFQQCLYLSYADVNVTNYCYKDMFHIQLNIWLVGITNYPKAKKIQYIKRIVIKVSKINSYANFSKFLKTYLEIFLIELTQNYALCTEMNEENKVEMNQLVVSVYSWENVEDFNKYLMKRLKNIICMQKRQLKTENIDNEYLSDDIFNQFFDENDYLLDSVELRITFYNKYSVDMAYLKSI